MDGYAGEFGTSSRAREQVALHWWRLGPCSRLSYYCHWKTKSWSCGTCRKAHSDSLTSNFHFSSLGSTFMLSYKACFHPFSCSYFPSPFYTGTLNVWWLLWETSLLVFFLVPLIHPCDCVAHKIWDSMRTLLTVDGKVFTSNRIQFSQACPHHVVRETIWRMETITKKMVNKSSDIGSWNIYVWA